MEEEQDLVGATLGTYRVRELVGRGGMGRVYAAEHLLLGKQVAIKVLLPKYSQDPDTVGRFFNEAKAATLIRHPGIVEVFDFGRHVDGSAYIVMELLEGESLATRLLRGRPSIDRVRDIAQQVCAALAAAHDKGIVHRDLKPDNVFLTRDPALRNGLRVKLLDFGIAKLARGTDGAAKTQTGLIMGTPLYMAPEQCAGAKQVDFAADLYSLGCVVFEMLAGRTPFVAAGVGEILAAHILTPAPTLREVNPSAPVELEGVVGRLLAKKPEDRYASARAVAIAFGEKEEEPTSGTVPVPRRSAVAVASTVSASNTLNDAASEMQGAPSTGTGSSEAGRRRRVSRFVAAVVIVLGVGTAATIGGMRLLAPRRIEQPPVVAVVSPPLVTPLPAPLPEKSTPAAPVLLHDSLTTEPSRAEVLDAQSKTPLGTTPYARDREASKGELVLLVRHRGYSDELVTFSGERGETRTLKLRRVRPGVEKPRSGKGSVGGVLDPFGK